MINHSEENLHLSLRNLAEMDVTGSTAFKGWLEKWKTRHNDKQF